MFSGREPSYHSKFGGLWVDRLDADQELALRVANRKVSPELASKIAQFMAEGYIVLSRAVDEALAGRIGAILTKAFAKGDQRLRYHTDGAENHVPAPGTDPRGKRIVESHGVLPDVREAFASPQIVEFLTAIFEEPPVLSQTLMFQMGSEQGYHRDTIFVRFDQPMRMVGCWISLEDVLEGSGELQYLVGSHRLPDFPFSSEKKDGIGVSPEELQRSLDWIVDESKRRGLAERVFVAKKGDALIWHADLAHGGRAIKNPNLSRQSVVGHLSPLSVGRSAHPSSAVRRQHGSICYSSTYYEL